MIFVRQRAKKPKDYRWFVNQKGLYYQVIIQFVTEKYSLTDTR